MFVNHHKKTAEVKIRYFLHYCPHTKIFREAAMRLFSVVFKQFEESEVKVAQSVQ